MLRLVDILREKLCAKCSVLLQGALTLKSIFLLGLISASVYKAGSFAPLHLTHFLCPVPFDSHHLSCLSLTACGAFARVCLSVLRDDVTTDDEAGFETQPQSHNAVENSSAKTALTFLLSSPSIIIWFENVSRSAWLSNPKIYRPRFSNRERSSIDINETILRLEYTTRRENHKRRTKNFQRKISFWIIFSFQRT